MPSHFNNLRYSEFLPTRLFAISSSSLSRFSFIAVAKVSLLLITSTINLTEKKLKFILFINIMFVFFFFLIKIYLRNFTTIIKNFTENYILHPNRQKINGVPFIEFIQIFFGNYFLWRLQFFPCFFHFFISIVNIFIHKMQKCLRPDRSKQFHYFFLPHTFLYLPYFFIA